MNWLLVVFYIAIGTFIFYKWKRLHFPALSRSFIVAVFLLKALLSIIYTMAHIRYHGGGDTFHFHKDGLILFDTLARSPLKYLMLCFGPNNLPAAPDFILKEVDAMGYWWDNSSYSVVRFYAITNLFTLGNIYATGIFMAFFSTIGLLLLYQVAMSNFPNTKTFIKIILFGIPSIMFWTSGIHKEGLILASLGVFFYATHQLSLKIFSAKYLLAFLFSAFAIWLIRDFVLYLLLPGALAFLLCQIHSKWVLPKFIVSYIIVLFAALSFQFTLHEKGEVYKANVIESINLKQRFFESLKGGNTAIDIEYFQPKLFFALKESPKAFFRTLCIPFYLTSFNKYQMVFVFENVFILFLIGYLLSQIGFRNYYFHAQSLWYFLFAVSLMVLIGIVVSNIGASLRYRSVPLLFLLLAFLPNLKIKNSL